MKKLILIATLAAVGFAATAATFVTGGSSVPYVVLNPSTISGTSNTLSAAYTQTGQSPVVYVTSGGLPNATNALYVTQQSLDNTNWTSIATNTLPSANAGNYSIGGSQSTYTVYYRTQLVPNGATFTNTVMNAN